MEQTAGKVNERRDVLGQILSGKDEQWSSDLDELTRLTRIAASPRRLVRMPEPSAKKTAATSRKRGPKRKTTSYLYPVLFERLGKAKSRLRRLAPKEIQVKVSKSEIVNCALMMALDEFDSTADDSRLVRLMLSDKPKKSGRKESPGESS